MSQATKQGAIRYILMILFQRVLGMALFYIAAGTIYDVRGNICLGLYMLVSVVACIMMWNGHQETLDERGKIQKNTKSWDKVLLPIYVLLGFYGIYFTAGLGVRFRWPQLPIAWFYLGTVLYVVASIFSVWPVMENKHFESTSRIQNDRSQQVISSGPYKIVRHPGYMGIVLWAIAIMLIFGTIAVGIVSIIIIIVIVIRTYLEDNMLKKELAGYKEYSNKVRYRLIPFIW